MRRNRFAEEGWVSGAAEGNNGGAEAGDFVGGEAADVGEIGEGLGGGVDYRAEERVGKDEERGEAGLFGFVATPVFEAGFEL